MLLSYSTSSGVLESLDLLPSCSVIAVSLHNPIILIITHQSISINAGGSGIKGLSASSADFESTLQGMEDACDSLLSDVAKTVEVGARAKTMQDKLYAGYVIVRGLIVYV